ncbi:hypothetical protein ANO11243_027970 [Dothideomycetidae sp. 11243]|nr:hypothetical protein ANO11243_027970 [fungal sp. No.11243]
MQQRRPSRMCAELKQYLTLTLRHLGFSTFESNMLAVPCAVLQMITVIGVAWSSQKFNERTWHCIVAHLFAVPFLVALEAMPVNTGMWERYSCTMFIVGAPSYYPIVLSWLSESSFSVKKRAISVSTFSATTVVGAILAAQAYQKRDEPYYYTGNKILIGSALLACLMFIVQRWVLSRANKERDKAWEAMPIPRQAEYQKTTEEMEFDGNQRLDFRFPL